MAKIEIDLDDVLGGFLKMVKKRHEEGKCGCKKHEGGAHSSEDEEEVEKTEYSEAGYNRVRALSEKALAKDGKGFVVAYDPEEGMTAMIIQRMHATEILSRLTAAIVELIDDAEISEIGKESLKQAVCKAILKS